MRNKLLLSFGLILAAASCAIKPASTGDDDSLKIYHYHYEMSMNSTISGLFVIYPIKVEIVSENINTNFSVYTPEFSLNYDTSTEKYPIIVVSADEGNDQRRIVGAYVATDFWQTNSIELDTFFLNGTVIPGSKIDVTWTSKLPSGIRYYIETANSDGDMIQGITATMPPIQLSYLNVNDTIAVYISEKGKLFLLRKMKISEF
ncbi:MAG: hypothetical protein HPY53_11185 [Brevinematales bacterium]|nr:hypothetical protein [Brevinematales bacterium]